MAPTQVIWLNRSRLSRPSAELIVAAVATQAPEFAEAWGVPAIGHVFVPLGEPIPKSTPDTLKAYFLNNSDEADALGYHSVDPAGDPYIRIFVDPILDNGGSITAGALSVSVCASHEACELTADPGCEQTATAANGDVWAYEVCDPVESTSYNITVAGKPVAVSDFVLAPFFQTDAAGPFDQCGAVTAPFTLAAGGYAVINGQEQFNDMADGTPYPAWRRATKNWPTARTWRRMHPNAITSP